MIPVPDVPLSVEDKALYDFLFLLRETAAGSSSESTASLLAALTAVTNAHIADFDNPHNTTWAEVVATGSTLGSVEAKSHTLLDDIGLNTHDQIDSHIADTNNPHQVTADQVNAAAGNLTGRDWARYFL